MRKWIGSTIFVITAIVMICLMFSDNYSNAVDDVDGYKDLTPPVVTLPTTIPPATSNNQLTPFEPMPDIDTNTKADKTYTLTFVGDCTLGTMPEWMSYASCFNNVIGTNYDHPFDAVRTFFSADDCTFINLEGVLGMEGTAQNKQFTFHGPLEYIQILTGSSVEIANITNNHTFDFGQVGYDSTVQVLKDNCIPYIAENDITVYTTNSGLTIGMYGVYFNLNEKDMQSDVQKLKDMGADVIVAACHWGIEREYQANTQQKNIAHKLIDAGVDIVWGHHPHVLQPIEEYKDGMIYYSLGNFSFGGNHNPSDKDTAIIQQTIIEHADGTFSLGALNAIPCRLSSKENYNDFQPTPYVTTDEGYMRVLQKLGLTQPSHTAPEASISGSTTASGANTTTPENEPEEPKETLQDKIQNGKVVLRRSFGFYKGSISMSQITKITFSRKAPSSYDEKWYANLAQTSDITGYRKGTEVYIVGENIYLNEYSGYMFARLNAYDEVLWGSLQSVEGLELLNLSTCRQTTCMFYEQKWSEIHGIENWDMSKVTSVQMMFAHCTNLTTLDIGKWNVAKVRNFSGLFSGNSWAGDMKFTYLPIENWNTSSATDMSHVFYGCAMLERAPVTYWDVSKVTTFSHMFADCYKLAEPNVQYWSTDSVDNFDALFNDCHALVTIDLSHFKTGTCRQFSQMFEACTNLEAIIGIDKWDISNASKAAFQQMFHCCYKLKKLDVPNWVGTPDDIARMFAHCRELEYVNISGLDLSKLTWVQEAFWDCPMLKEIVWKQEYDFSTIEGFDSMWNECNPDVKHTCLT